jgi:O-methyltransferase
LLKSYLTGLFWGVADSDPFCRGIQQALDQVAPEGIFIGDNLLTFQKNLGFLENTSFMSAFDRHAQTDAEKTIIWRTHVLCWAAKRAMRMPGDFVECGCYRGTTARIIHDYVGFATSDKHYYLYDLFVHTPDMPHHAHEDHGEDLYDKVRDRFSGLDRVHVTQGSLPEVLQEIAPEKISLLHLDLNNAPAEIWVLHDLFDRVVPGGSIILDDYGWRFYRAQMEAEDAFFEEKGYSVLELPTGQGLVIK